MALLGTIAGLTLCTTGIAYKNLKRNITAKHALDASAYAHGMDRRTATWEEKTIVDEKFEWDIKNRKGELCPLEMIDFFENGARGYDNAKSCWVGCMTDQFFEDMGINPVQPLYCTRGANYMKAFLDEYEKNLYYWDILRKQGIRYNDISERCPVCGHFCSDVGEPCPVCGNPPAVKVDKSYTQAKLDEQNERNKADIQYEKELKTKFNRFKAIWVISAFLLLSASVIFFTIQGLPDLILSSLLLCVTLGFVPAGIYLATRK